MAMQFLNHTETPLNFVKSKKNHKSSNLKSFWAFLISIFIYISVFYVFKLSPSTLFSTTKFWFFLLNTLILVVAVDFGVFSMSKEHDFYEEYVKHSIEAKNIPSLETQYMRIVEETRPNCDHEKEAEQKQHEKIIDMVLPAEETMLNCEHEKEAEPKQHEKIIDMVLPAAVADSRHVEKTEAESGKNQKEIVLSTNLQTKNGGVPIKKRIRSMRARSKSDKAIVMVPADVENKGKMVVRRTLSERPAEEPRFKETEFSRMSIEELNTRAEEFIQRVNRQIRLQATRNQRQLEPAPYSQLEHANYSRQERFAITM